MLRVFDLKFGFSNAGNYRRRENRQLLNKFSSVTSILTNSVSPAFHSFRVKRVPGKPHTL